MAKRIIGSTPKADGYRMPAEFEPQDGVWMLLSLIHIEMCIRDSPTGSACPNDAYCSNSASSCKSSSSTLWKEKTAPPFRSRSCPRQL